MTEHIEESKHTPGPWVWMDVNQNVPCADNDGSRGLDGLYRDIDGTDDDLRVLAAIQSVEDLPLDNPYRKRFEAKTEMGDIVFNNLADMALIAAAPEMFEALRVCAAEIAACRHECVTKSTHRVIERLTAVEVVILAAVERALGKADS